MALFSTTQLVEKPGSSSFMNNLNDIYDINSLTVNDIEMQQRKYRNSVISNSQKEMKIRKSIKKRVKIQKIIEVWWKAHFRCVIQLDFTSFHWPWKWLIWQILIAIRCYEIVVVSRAGARISCPTPTESMLWDTHSTTSQFS